MKYSQHGTLMIWLSIVGVVLLIGRLPVDAQLSARFGKNKVHYKDFRWDTLTTAHFTIYFYQGEERLARNTEKMAERAYAYLAHTLHHEIAERIPLIIYASSDDFQQTDVIEGMIGEGLGGVTESLRGRIVIPFLGSYRELNHVLLHELVHAFQLNILNEGRPGLRFMSSLAIPLWFMEGMAEYCSEYGNPATEMWLSDAVWNDTVPSARQLDRLGDIRAYRFGEALIAFLAENYGEATLGELLRALSQTEDWDDAIQQVAQISWETLYEQWQTSLTERYRAEATHLLAIDRQATRLIAHDADNFFFNILPAVSPDGKYLAFISDRNLDQTIYLADADTGAMIKPLVEGDWRGTYETLRFLHTSIAWAPDSRQIAFNAKAGGENAIYILDIHSRAILKTLTPAVLSIGSFTWSPDGTHIAFSGVQHGQEDLFLLTLETQAVAQVTDDLYTNRQPAWSPDGSVIAFITDAGKTSSLPDLTLGCSNIALYDVTATTTTLLTDTAADEKTPVWSPDGRWLAYTADYDGVYNLYLLNVQEHLAHHRSGSFFRPIQATTANTGVVGLTPDTPAITWAQATGDLFFSGFTHEGWDIFVLKHPIAQYQEYLAEVGSDDERLLARSTDADNRQPGYKDWGVAWPIVEEAAIKPYHARLRPEYILGGGGGSSKYFIILARLGFSDMLSNHQLQISGNFTNVLDDSEFLVEYINRAHRLSYALGAFQFQQMLGAYTSGNGEIELDIERGIGLDVAWPFDKFRRLEFSLEGRMVDGELKTPELEEPQDVEDQFFLAPSLAYVYDSALYTALGPLAGRRFRLGIYPALGDLTYLTIVGDQRWYWHATRRSALALRLLALGSFGENARIFDIGGAATFRGRKTTTKEILRGRQVALGNLEYRFPLLPNINLLRGAVFTDLAMVWSDTVQPFTTVDTTGVKLHDLRAAYGIGVRIPIQSPLGLMTIRFDMAQETDLARNLGKRKYLFSIGNDF